MYIYLITLCFCIVRLIIPINNILYMYNLFDFAVIFIPTTEHFIHKKILSPIVKETTRYFVPTRIVFYAILYIISMHFIETVTYCSRIKQNKCLNFSLFYRYTYLIVKFINYHYCNCFFEEYNKIYNMYL